MISDELGQKIDAFMEAELLPREFVVAVEQIFLPLADAITDYAEQTWRPCVVGLCGPQGSGKSTGAAIIRLLLEARGLRVAILSLDDLYLTRAVRNRLAADIHPLLATRGPPGTHDAAYGIALLDRLKRVGLVSLPSFDKAADDQRAAEHLATFNGPADVVLFEGWCVGAMPEEPAALTTPINELEAEHDPAGIWRTFVNDALSEYQALFAHIDFQILLQPPAFEAVARWRKEQEAKLRIRSEEQGGVTLIMSDHEVDRFVQHYERLTRHIIREMPGRSHAVVELGGERELNGLRLEPPSPR